MFGVLRPQRHSLRYRRLYARLCQHYRANYGLRAVLWLNYETVFLYAIALDLGLLPAAAIKEQRCCKLRRDPMLEEDDDNQIGSLLASIGLLLGSLKVDDDLRDKPSLVARLTDVVFHKLFRRARVNLFKYDPDFEAKLTAIISAQDEVESNDVHASLETFSQPTVLGFTAVFELLARELSPRTQSPLARLAGPIARAIVSFDQSIDFEQDRQGGGYTVLSFGTDRLPALHQARRHIDEASTISAVWLGPHSLASEILAGFRHRIESSIKDLQDPSAPRLWCPGVASMRKFYLTGLALLMPAVAMAAESNQQDDDCTSHGCCCFCLGYLCGEGSSQARR